MIRLWFKDGSYMDIPQHELEYYEMDPNLDRVEYPIVLQENGK